MLSTILKRGSASLKSGRMNRKGTKWNVDNRVYICNCARCKCLLLSERMADATVLGSFRHTAHIFGRLPTSINQHGPAADHVDHDKPLHLRPFCASCYRIVAKRFQ
jgi:hypothetical protein